MTATVAQLLDRYRREHGAGGAADPVAFLARAAPWDRPELARLIDSFLASAPRQRFDPAGYRGSGAERTVERLAAALSAPRDPTRPRPPAHPGGVPSPGECQDPADDR